MNLPTRLVLAAVLAVALAGCGSASDAGEEQPLLMAHGTDRYPNTTVTDWVTYADHVVVATATDQRAVPLDEGETGDGAASVDRFVTMRVDDVLWSSEDPRKALPPGSFEWSAWGWALQGGKRVPMAGPDQPRVEVGHTYIFALVWHPAVPDETSPLPARWVSLGADSVLPYDGAIGVGELEGAVRSKPLRVAASDLNYSFEDAMAGKSAEALAAELERTEPTVRGDYGPIIEDDGT